MARQSTTQHLDVLGAGNLVTTVRRGREKLHYLNPAPLWKIQERWIARYEEPRLRALSTIRQRAEEKELADRPSYVYVTYIEASPETHEDLPDDALEAISAGWPAVFATLKSFLETGRVLPRAPWEMHAQLRAAQMAANDPASATEARPATRTQDPDNKTRN